MATKKLKRGEIMPRWTIVERATILNVIEVCNGGSLLSARMLHDRGIPMRLIERHIATFKVATRNADGSVDDRVEGVHSLDLLRGICSDLGLRPRVTTGPETDAVACKVAIIAHFGQMKARV